MYDLFWEGMDRTLARREQARLALQKAQALQPDAGNVHLAAGIYAYHGFMITSARDRNSRPDSPRSAQLLAGIHDDRCRRPPAGTMGRCLAPSRSRGKLDPLNFTNLQEAGFTREILNRFEEARPLLQRALAINPKNSHVRVEPAMLPYYRAADVRAWREEMDKILGEGREATSPAALWLVNCALAERNSAAADAAWAMIPEAGAANPYDNSVTPREFFVGLVARTFGDKAGAEAAFTRARVIAAKKAEEQPEYTAA